LEVLSGSGGETLSTINLGIVGMRAYLHGPVAIFTLKSRRWLFR